MSKTIAVHVRYESLYIFVPSSANQQREITKFLVVCWTGTTTANFSSFHLDFKAAIAYLAIFSSVHWQSPLLGAYNRLLALTRRKIAYRPHCNKQETLNFFSRRNAYFWWRWDRHLGKRRPIVILDKYGQWKHKDVIHISDGHRLVRFRVF